MKKTYEITIESTISRTIVVNAWSIDEAEEEAAARFRDDIHGDYDIGTVEVVDVELGGPEDMD